MKTHLKKTEEKVIRFISDNNLLVSGDKVIIALSGGADSVFLLHFLHKFKKKYRITLAALHINHMLRGKDAAEDAGFCRKLCSQLNVRYFSVKKNVNLFAKKNKISVEEAGRILRYRELEKTCSDIGFSKIATAHNCNDNSETVLLNLIKGTGLRGLAGIPASRGNIIRPILPVTKSEILNYLNTKMFDYRFDQSNISDDYERNYIRNNIIPLIQQKLNPSFDEAVFKSSTVIKKHYSAIMESVEELLIQYAKNEENIVIFNDKLRDNNEAILTELIRTAVFRNFSVQLAFNELTALNNLFFKKRGSKIKLPSGLASSRGKNNLVIYRLKNEMFTPAELKINEKLRLNSKYLYITEAEKSGFTSGNPEVEYIAADDIDSTFIIRQWQKGDKFFPLGMKGSKKLSDFLNEKKIETYIKQKTLVLTNRNRIVWVIGLRLDNRFRITESTKKVLKLCLK